MIQPLFAFADLGFFLLRLFVGVLLLEEGWKGLRSLCLEKRYGFVTWMLPSALTLLGLLFITGTATQLAALMAVVFLVVVRRVREPLFPSMRSLGLFIVALLALATAGGGVLSVDQLFGFILY